MTAKNFSLNKTELGLFFGSMIELNCEVSVERTKKKLNCRVFRWKGVTK